MISVLSGTDAELQTYCRRTYEGPLDVLVAPDFGWVEPWAVLRRMLPVLRELRGSEVVDDTLQRYPVAASFVFSHLREGLSPEERARRRSLEARISSHMTHNEVVRDLLFEEVAPLFHDLLAPGMRLVLPNIARCDPSSLALVRTAYRLFPDMPLSLVLGHDPETPVETDDADILWSYTPLMLKAYVARFHTLEGFRRIRFSEQALSDEAGAGVGNEGDETDTGKMRKEAGRDPLDRDLEGRAWRALRALSENELSGDAGDASDEVDRERARELALAAIDASFETYAFRTVLQLGLELLRRDLPLAAAEEARVRNLVGLSAHNRQFTAQSGPRLPVFLETQYRQALELERDPLLRICLLYRLAVAVGRRQRRIEPALAFADQGLELLADAELPPEEALMQEAWLRNIRAFLLMRCKKIDAAFEEERRAIRLLDRCERESEILAADARLSRAVAADNLSELAILIRDEGQRERWHQVTQELVGGWLGLGHLTSRMWMNFHRAGLRLQQAREHAETGVRESRRQQAYVLEYTYLVNQADFTYRLGDPARALALYERALPFRDHLGDDVDIRLPLEAATIAAAARLGDLPRAKAELQRLAEDREVSAVDRAELEATAGWLAALDREPEAAESRINRAIELAVDSGVRDVLLRVALRAAQTCRLLERPDDAQAAYRQALEIADAGDPESPPPPADLAQALLGLARIEAESGAPAPDRLATLVRLYPEALLEDPEAWWSLDDLLAVLETAHKRAQGTGTSWLQEDPEDPDLVSALHRIHRAARQRDDCRQRLAALAPIFPDVDEERGGGSEAGDRRSQAPATAASGEAASAP